MDWQWFFVAIVAPVSIALWKVGENLLKRWGEVKIARVEAEAKAALESQKDEREHKQKRESLELTTALGNQSFKDDQITMMAAEAQGEAQAYSQFFREQYAQLIGQMVTQEELKAHTKRLEEVEKRVVTIDTYLRSIIQELRDDRDRYRRLAEGDLDELVSKLRDELESLKAQMGPK